MGSNFGLGLVLTFTDKATAGMSGAVAMFNQLDAAANGTSSTLGTLGGAVSSLTSLGTGLTAAITAPVAAFLGTITNYGIARASFVEDMHLAFTSLMGDAQTASDYMQQLMSFAKTTPYTYEGITSAAQTMITYGYKANDILSETNGQFKGILQAIGDWAGASGAGEAGFTQVAEILGKINAEGKIGSERFYQLQNAGIQAADIIGNMYDMSSDKAQEFIKSMDVDQFVSDLTKGLEEGTSGINGVTGAMAGQMMNLKNTWTGAKDTWVSSLKTAGLELMGMYTDDFGVSRYEFLDTMTASLNKLSAAVKLVSPALQPLVTLMQSVMTKGSELILNAANAFNSLGDAGKSAVAKIVSGLVLLGPALLIIGKYGGTLLTLVANLKKLFSIFNPGMLMMGAVLGATYLMWESDFLGMRTAVTEFVSTLVTSFSTAWNAINGDVSSLRVAFSQLDQNSFKGELTTKLMQLMIVVRALKEGWSDFEISEDTFNKASELGVLPLIERLFDLKYRFDFFKQGFVQGWENIKTAVSNAVQAISGVLGPVFGGMLESVGNFFKSLSEGDVQAWTTAGKAVAYLSAGILGLVAAIKVIGTIVSVFTGVVNVIRTIATAVRGVITSIRMVVTVIRTVATVVRGVMMLLAANPVVLIIAAIVIAIIALVIVVRSHWEQIKAVLGQIGSWIMTNVVTPVKNFFTTLGQAVMMVFSSIGSFISSVFSTIANVVSSVVQAIINFFSNAASAIKSAWEAVKGFFSNLFASIKERASEVKAKITNAFSNAANSVKNVWNSIKSFFANIFNQIVSKVAYVKSKIVSAFSSAASAVKSVWNGIVGFFQGIWDKISGIVSKIKSAVSFVTGIGSTPAAAKGVENFVGGLIQVNEEGGELINLPSGSTVIPHDKSIEEGVKKGIELGSQAMALYASSTNSNNQGSTPVSSGDSYIVTFAAGSVVVKLSNASDAELEKAADKLLKIISRKTELRNMAQRNTKRVPSYA